MLNALTNHFILFILLASRLLQSELIGNAIAKESWDFLGKTTPFLSSVDFLAGGYVERIPYVTTFIKENTRASWLEFWDGEESTPGGKHYVWRKYRDFRISAMQGIVSKE